MKTIQLVGYRPGLNTVSLIRALHDYGRLTLADSTKIVEELISGTKPCVRLRSQCAVEQFSKIASELGVNIE